MPTKEEREIFKKMGIDIDEYIDNEDYQREVLSSLPEDLKEIAIGLALYDAILQPLDRLVSYADALGLLKMYIEGDISINTETFKLFVTNNKIEIQLKTTNNERNTDMFV